MLPINPEKLSNGASPSEAAWKTEASVMGDSLLEELTATLQRFMKGRAARDDWRDQEAAIMDQ